MPNFHTVLTQCGKMWTSLSLENFFREINSLVISLVKWLHSRFFCQNCVREISVNSTLWWGSPQRWVSFHQKYAVLATLAPSVVFQLLHCTPLFFPWKPKTHYLVQWKIKSFTKTLLIILKHTHKAAV